MKRDPLELAPLVAANLDPDCPPRLEVRALCKKYGEFVALQPADLVVRRGEFLTLLGPSGSGKTTLLQLIAGLATPTSGQVMIDGRDSTHTPVPERGIGLVFQNYALFPHMTIAENVGFSLRMRRVPKAEIARRVAAVLEMVHLGPLGDRYPNQLSGGQQQRAALARCFVYEPSIILMDEPLGALDKNLRDHMQREIKRLHRETGATIIYVTHDQEEALALSDRICVLNNARIAQIGTPTEIYNLPRTEFVANFIGISNIFRGKAVWNGEQLSHVVTPHGQFKVGTAVLEAGSAEAALVVRPQAMQLGGNGDNEVSGTVVDTVYVGSEARVIVALADDMQVTARLGAEVACPALGEKVRLSWHSERGVAIS